MKTNDLRGKKLLILSGASVHCKVVEEAKKMGIYTIVTDNLKESPAKNLANERWELSITDITSIVERCKKAHVDGVINYCIDPAQKPYQKICEKLNLPCFGTYEQFCTLTDKRKFKDFCNANDVDVILDYSKDDVLANKVTYPIFIKPTDSRGSRGQSVCYTRDEALLAIEFAHRESNSGQAIIEKYIIGKPDFSMTYVVVEGEPYLVRVTDRYHGREEDGLSKQTILSVAPSKYTTLYLSNVDEKVKQMIKKLGLRNAPVFMQGFVDNGTVYFYDPGLRFPGGEYDIAFYKATGINLMKRMIEFALKGTFNSNSLQNSYKLNGLCSIQMTMAAYPGKVGQFKGEEDVLKNPFVVKFSSRYTVGQEIPASGDVRQRIYELVALISDKSSVKEFIKWAFSKIIVVDEKGENMVCEIDEDIFKSIDINQL